MILTLEDLMELAEKVSDVTKEDFCIMRYNSRYYAWFGTWSRVVNPRMFQMIPYSTAKEALIAALKAVKPKG